MIQETKSKWSEVAQLLKQSKPVELGKRASYWGHRMPRRTLYNMSYYKFAAKLIGKDKRVLDVGCGEGLGTFLLGKECGFAQGFDFDEQAIDCARKNFSEPYVEFTSKRLLLKHPTERFDALSSFDVIARVQPENVSLFWKGLQLQMKPEGIAILGTPSETFQGSSERFLNVYSQQRLEQEMRRHFEHVFLFSANDELIHTGFLPMAQYLIAVGCGVKAYEN